MVMGRPNKGVDHVGNCDGSKQSKLRTQVVLQTISGELTVNDALEILGIQRAHFAKLRLRALQGAVDALEPGRPGRRRRHDAEIDQRAVELASKIAQLEKQLQLERARADIAQILPGRNGDQKGGSMTRQERRKLERERQKRKLG